MGRAMNHRTRQRLLEAAGSHLAFVKGMRVQVLDARSEQQGLWPLKNGNLLIVVLGGACTVETASQKAIVAAGEQVLLHEGEQFRLQRANSEEEAIVQMVWAPGISGDP